MDAGALRRLTVTYESGRIELIEMDRVFYLEAQREKTLIRIRRKKPYISIQRLGDIEKVLPKPAFFRCHREYIVNLNRVRSLLPRETRGYDIKLDPPVNKRIPVARTRLTALRRILGI